MSDIVIFSPLHIGYLSLSNLAYALNPSEPVYVAPYVETTWGAAPGQNTDHHFIMVTQPDDKNRVHYCRIPVVRLVYHNGIAFAPDYAEQLEKVDVMLGEVEDRLRGEGYNLRRGIVMMPQILRFTITEI